VLYPLFASPSEWELVGRGVIPHCARARAPRPGRDTEFVRVAIPFFTARLPVRV